ncbi:unnamed protein product [Diatraea saccharalis]|uniref:Chemosensory protein n=1 Tax=Diatraea saccharalis TaxID=40085 RepID=A0A9N9WK12_9NEOP|nr:unnamed protein product [Diatraea saccharalis]
MIVLTHGESTGAGEPTDHLMVSDYRRAWTPATPEELLQKALRRRGRLHLWSSAPTKLYKSCMFDAPTPRPPQIHDPRLRTKAILNAYAIADAFSLFKEEPRNQQDLLHTQPPMKYVSNEMAAKYFIALCLVVAAVARPSDKYTDKYDNLNLDEILENKRLLLAYVNCILDKGKCSPEGKELKEHLQEAIETGCAKCTEAQEKGAYRAIEFLIKNELDIWHQLTDKFDHEGKWRKKYEDRARANGIVIPE